MRVPFVWAIPVACVVASVSACTQSSGGVPTESSGNTLSLETRLAVESRAGAGDDSDEVGLRARAAKGLQISPVPLRTSGLTRRQMLRVGLGSYIVNGTADCNGCHGSAAGFLAGGNPFFLDRARHVVWSRNLTPDANTGLTLTEDQFVQTIRTGKDHLDQSRMLVVMPWLIYRWMSDEDLKAVYAYLRAVPPAQNAVPPDNKSDLPLPPAVPFPGKYTDGEIDRRLPHDARSFSPRRGLAIAPRAHPADLEDLEDDELRSYALGSYIANSMSACNECHTNPDRTPDSSKINTAAYLSGGTVFAVPPPLQPVLHQVRATSANLVGEQYGFFNEPEDSYARFSAIIHTQSHADETPPRPLGFPMVLIAGNLSKVLDEDLRAIYAYVKGVPSVAGAADQPRQDYARYCQSSTDCQAGESCASNECVGKACAADIDCDTCQTCAGGACAAPATNSACLASAR